MEVGEGNTSPFLFMFYNFSQMKSELLNRLKTNNQGVSQQRLGNWLNDAQDVVASEMDPDHLIRTESITTVAGQRKYATNFDFNKIISVIDVTNDFELYPTTEGSVESFDPALDDSGAPYYFFTSGLDWVLGKQTSSGTISVVSTSTADTNVSVRIRGLVNGVEDFEIILLNGTTPVDGTKSFSEVYAISKNGTSTGKITVTANDYSEDTDPLDEFVLDTSTLEDPVNTVLATFAPKELAHQKQPLFVYPKPTDARELRLRGIRRPRKMLHDEDYPDFPEAYHELIIIAATVRGHHDLFRPQLAEIVRDKEYMPFMLKLKKQMGNKRNKYSQVISGATPLYFTGGRLPPEYGWDD